MSIYNSSVKTHIIDPVYSRNNFRAEYRLEPETIYLTNWRLLNVGAIGNNGTKSYNGLVGALGVIKHISLYDDNQLLDQVLEAPTWLGFKAVNNKNQDSMDLESNLRKNRAGNCLTGIDRGAGMLGLKLDEWTVNDYTTGKTDGSVLGQRGYLRLKEVFPLLNNMEGAIPTTMFKNLKVVIEYSQDLDEFMTQTNDTGTQTTEPVLVVDEVVGEKGVQKFGNFKGVSYTSIEHDRVNVPALKVVDGTGGDFSNTNPAPLKQTTLHVNGFNNKTVGRCLMVKTPTLLSSYKTATDNHRFGKICSYAFCGEALQVRVNGSSIFSGRGLTNPAQRQALVNDVWGVSSFEPFSHLVGYSEADATDRSGKYHGGANDVGNLDYWGWSVNNKVQDFQIDYDRKANYVFGTGAPPDTANKDANDVLSSASRFNQAIEINLFCEVYKSIVVKGNSYEVVYV